MELKVKGFDLKGNYKGRSAIISHNDPDGVVSALNAVVSNRYAGIDSLVLLDITPKVSKTDELINKALDSLESAGLEMFESVFILDRASCSRDMLIKLIDLGVKRVIHLDHHETNHQLSIELENEFGVNVFKSIFRPDGYADSNSQFSASMVSLTNLIDFSDDDSNSLAILMALNIIVDLWDTFKWTNEWSSEDLKKQYSFLYNLGYNNKYLNEFLTSDKCDTAVSVYNIFKFEGSNYMFKYIMDLITHEENICGINSGLEKILNTEILSGYDRVINNYKEMTQKNLNYLRYAYKDAINGKTDMGSYIKEFDLTYAGVTNTYKVLFVGRAMDFNTYSTASHYFLQEHPELILVMKTSEFSHVYSVRSTGNVPAISLATMFGGGGHLNAGGFTLEPVKAKLEESKMMFNDIFLSKAKK